MKKITYRRKQKEKKEKPEKKPWQPNIKLILYSFVVTVMLYFMLIYVERAMVNDEKTVMVCIVKSGFAKDTVVSGQNAENLFSFQERPIYTLPSDYVTDMSQILGLISDRNYEENEVVTAGSFSNIDDRINGIDRPVEVSLNASSLSQVVGGVLRAGDYVNIWSVKSVIENGSVKVRSEQICMHAYVTRAFTSSGSEVERDTNGSSESTTVINIIIPASQEEAYNNAIVEGTLRVGRCMYEAEE